MLCPAAALPGADPRTPVPSALHKHAETPSGTPPAALRKRAPRSTASGLVPPPASHPLGEWSRASEKFLLTGRDYQASQALGLGTGHPPPEVRYPVVAASLVVQRRVGALLGLLDEPLG